MLIGIPIDSVSSDKTISESKAREFELTEIFRNTKCIFQILLILFLQNIESVVLHANHRDVKPTGGKAILVPVTLLYS